MQFMEKSVFIYYFAIGHYFGLLEIRMHFWTWKLWKCSSHMSHCREHNWLTVPALSLWVCPHIYAKVMLWPVLGQWLNLARICRQGCLCWLASDSSKLRTGLKKVILTQASFLPSSLHWVQTSIAVWQLSQNPPAISPFSLAGLFLNKYLSCQILDHSYLSKDCN